MSRQTNEGPFPGSTCVASAGGYWERATIRRVNEDGTFTIAPVVSPSPIMPYWYGTTLAEVSFGDNALWHDAFARIADNPPSLTFASFASIVTSLGFTAPLEQVRQFWLDTCTQKFGLSEPNVASLSMEQSYELFLATGVSAKQLGEFQAAGGLPREYHKLYWNMTRMGGRDPTEVKRVVTLHDALTAVGAGKGQTSVKAATELQSFEATHSIRLPEALKTILSRRNIDRLVCNAHPNNPQLQLIERDGWELHQGLASAEIDSDYAVTIMLPHQGDHEWVAVFNSGDDDARIYLRWKFEEPEVWRLTAPTVGMFFWDLAQTGLAWYRETEFKGRPRIDQTDIGLAVRA